MKEVIIRSAWGGVYEMKIATLLGEMVLEAVRQRVWNFMYVSFRDFWPNSKIFIFREDMPVWSKKSDGTMVFPL